LSFIPLLFVEIKIQPIRSENAHHSKIKIQKVVERIHHFLKATTYVCLYSAYLAERWWKIDQEEKKDWMIGRLVYSHKKGRKKLTGQ
jgi:hypothetical protein